MTQTGINEATWVHEMSRQLKRTNKENENIKGLMVYHENRFTPRSKSLYETKFRTTTRLNIKRGKAEKSNAFPNNLRMIK